MPVEPTMPDTFVARHALTATRRDPGSYVEAVFATRLMAGKPVTQADAEDFLRTVGAKDDPAALLASAQNLSRSKEAAVLLAAKLSDCDLTEQLAEIAARYRRYRLYESQPSPGPNLSVLSTSIRDYVSGKRRTTNQPAAPSDPIAVTEAIVAVRIMTGKAVTLDEAATLLRNVGIPNGNPESLIKGARSRIQYSGLQLGDSDLYARLAAVDTRRPAPVPHLSIRRRLLRSLVPKPDAAQIAKLIQTFGGAYSAILAGDFAGLSPYAGITVTSTAPVAKDAEAAATSLPVTTPIQRPESAPMPNPYTAEATPLPSPIPAPHCASTEPSKTPAHLTASDMGGAEDNENIEEDEVAEEEHDELEATEDRPQSVPLMSWEEEESGKEGQLNLPAFTDMPTLAERAFILLAREWRKSVRSNEPLTNIQAIREQKTIWACLLLAVRWGHTFTSLPAREVGSNQWSGRHNNKFGWLDRQAWDLCEYCLLKTPRSSPPIRVIDQLVAALSHEDSSTRKRVFDFVWLAVPKIPAAYTVAAVQALLRDVAGTLRWHSHAAALASRFFNTRTCFITYAQQFQPTTEYAQQYAERLGKVERRLADVCTPFIEIENHCWQLITETLLGKLFVPFALPSAFEGKDMFPHLAYPEPSSLPALTPAQTGLLSRLGPIWHTRYTRRELDMLVGLPWNQLPQRLKDKTRRFHDDPASLKRPEDWPTLGTPEEKTG